MDILFSIILIAVAITISYFGYMIFFMGAGFLILSVLKLIDLRGFMERFRTYDLLAEAAPIYSFFYPFIELFIGICFLFHVLIKTSAVITLIIMGIGIVSITKNLISKEKKSCACLGAKINIPLTRFTLVEDIIMFVMAIILLV